MGRKSNSAKGDTSLNSAALGAKLRAYRLAAKLTQTEVEELCSVRRDYVSSIELGRIGVVYPDTFNRLRDAYNFPGFDVLETMGFKTDAAQQEIQPSLLAIIGTMTHEQQAALAELARAACQLGALNEVAARNSVGEPGS